MDTPPTPLVVAVVLFDGFELLDVGAPCELLGAVASCFRLVFAAEGAEPVSSSCLAVSGGQPGPAVVPTHRLIFGDPEADSFKAGLSRSSDAGAPLVVPTEGYPYGQRVVPDVVLVPGGKGVRTAVDNVFLNAWLRKSAETTKIVFTVCTGSWLLAATGGIDGRHATSNNAALAAAGPQTAGPRVAWLASARWVEDEADDGRLLLTSSGVSAGGDAALALIARVAGADEAERVATAAEWTWHRDKDADPFHR